MTRFNFAFVVCALQLSEVTSGEDGSAGLTPERANKLIKLGFEWQTTNPHHTPWETRYEALKDFVVRMTLNDLLWRILWSSSPNTLGFSTLEAIWARRSAYALGRRLVSQRWSLFLSF
jgi:hypothetical protein